MRNECHYFCHNHGNCASITHLTLKSTDGAVWFGKVAPFYLANCGLSGGGGLHVVWEKVPT